MAPNADDRDSWLASIQLGRSNVSHAVPNSPAHPRVTAATRHTSVSPVTSSRTEVTKG
ncbi:hypothetical protein BCR44DRAFT_36282 [Catenaria anguillulae PL171]|uniref:PH domain-containing protein n=1 Tax=Catenaria anguillulae PL171 TaxID=765915 RepID=A0A1Y2HPM8_9FUNG|nr:hypothetical protein BCR44DRAFT_36282 [Catenaria anguillulae PL171]